MDSAVEAARSDAGFFNRETGEETSPLDMPWRIRVMAGKLRQDLRRFEAENDKKVRCLGVVRCLHCPLSFLGCPVARRWMK